MSYFAVAVDSFVLYFYVFVVNSLKELGKLLSSIEDEREKVVSSIIFVERCEHVVYVIPTSVHFFTVM